MVRAFKSITAVIFVGFYIVLYPIIVIDMENLLEETKEKLADCHKTPKDVLWVGTSDGSEAITWEEFEKLANFEYDNGRSHDLEIRSDLVVVGKGWWLQREEWPYRCLWVYHLPKLLRLHKEHKKLKELKEADIKRF